nr:MAG TPA: hypothetical protein [Caudoviricetes sp.]
MAYLSELNIEIVEAIVNHRHILYCQYYLLCL